MQDIILSAATKTQNYLQALLLIDFVLIQFYINFNSRFSKEKNNLLYFNH